MASQRFYTALGWIVAFAILGVTFSYTFSISEFSDFLHVLVTINPIWIFIMASTELGTYCCSALMYRTMFRALGYQARMKQLIPLSLAKLAVDQFIPTAGVGGSAVVVRGLRNAGVSRQIAIGMVIVGLAGWYFAGNIAGFYGLWAIRNMPVALAGAIPIAIAYVTVSIFIIYFTLRGVRTRWFGKIHKLLPGKALDQFFTELIQTHDLQLPRKVGFHKIVIAQLGMILLDTGTLAFACLAINNPLPFTTLLAAYALVNMAATVSVLPGGIGVFEGGLIAMLSLFGMPPASALAATLLYRGFSVWLPMVPGALFARYEMKKQVTTS